VAIRLMQDEEILWESYQGVSYRRLHLIKDSLLTLMIVGAIYFMVNAIGSLPAIKISLLALVIGVAYVAIEQFKLRLVKYVITNERVIIRKGWLNVKLTSINLINILDTKAEQTVLEKLIRTGTVYLFTANDSQNSDDNFLQNVPKIANIDDPFGLHSKISEIIKESKRR